MGIRAREEKPGPWKPRARATARTGRVELKFGDPVRGRGAHDGARQEKAAWQPFLVFGVEADAFARRIRRGEKLADGIKDNFELLVVVVFENTDLACQFLDRESHLADANEGAHDADVDGHGTRTVENAGKHGDAFLSKRIGQIPAATAALV